MTIMDDHGLFLMIGAAVHTLPFLQMYSVEMNLCPAYWWLMMREDVVQFHFAWQALHFVHILEGQKSMASAVFEELTLFRCYSVVKHAWDVVLRGVWVLCQHVLRFSSAAAMCSNCRTFSREFVVAFSSSNDVVFSVGLLLWSDVSGDFFSGAFVVGVPFCNSRNATKKSLLEKSSRKRARRDVFTKRVQTKCSRIKKFVQEDLSKTPVQETFQNLGNRCQEMLV